MDYQKLFDLMSEHGLTLLEGEMDEIIETVNEIQQPRKEQGERSGVKTAQEICNELSGENDKGSSTIRAMHIYAKQVAEAVLTQQIIEVCKYHPDASLHQIKRINISDFIK